MSEVFHYEIVSLDGEKQYGGFGTSEELSLDDLERVGRYYQERLNCDFQIRRFRSNG